MTKPQAQERRRRPGSGPGPELRAPGSRRRDQPWTCKIAFILQFHLQQYLQQFNFTIPFTTVFTAIQLGIDSSFCCARTPSANLSRKARLSRVHLKEVELAKGVRGD